MQILNLPLFFNSYYFVNTDDFLACNFLILAPVALVIVYKVITIKIPSYISTTLLISSIVVIPFKTFIIASSCMVSISCFLQTSLIIKALGFS